MTRREPSIRRVTAGAQLPASFRQCPPGSGPHSGSKLSGPAAGRTTRGRLADAGPTQGSGCRRALRLEIVGVGPRPGHSTPHSSRQGEVRWQASRDEVLGSDLGLAPQRRGVSPGAVLSMTRLPINVGQEAGAWVSVRTSPGPTEVVTDKRGPSLQRAGRRTKRPGLTSMATNGVGRRYTKYATERKPQALGNLNLSGRTTSPKLQRAGAPPGRQNGSEDSRRVRPVWAWRTPAGPRRKRSPLPASRRHEGEAEANSGRRKVCNCSERVRLRGRTMAKMVGRARPGWARRTPAPLHLRGQGGCCSDRSG